MAFCANCGTKIEEGIKFCPGCGKAASGVSNEPVASVVQQQTAVIQPRPMADEMYCFSCGSVIKKIAEICPKCGVKQNANSQNAPTEKKNIVFLVLSIFFIVVGMILNIYAYIYADNDNFSAASRFYAYGTSSAVAIGVILIGIIFSIISHHRKQNKMYFWLCISPCIFLELWNIFVLFGIYINSHL